MYFDANNEVTITAEIRYNIHTHKTIMVSLMPLDVIGVSYTLFGGMLKIREVLHYTTSYRSPLIRSQPDLSSYTKCFQTLMCTDIYLR